MPAVETIHSVAHVLRWVENNTSGTTIFRGQSDAGWALESRIARVPNARRVEKNILAEFKRRSRPHLSNEPKSDLEWLAIAQHHGLPTRLLDWSTSPLAALWFATKDYTIKKGNARLWAFLPDSTITMDDAVDARIDDPFQQTAPVLIYPPQITARITAQNGCFTLQPYDEEHRTFVRLDSLKNLIASIVIPIGCLEGITQELDRCGINEMSMFQVSTR